MAPSEWCSNHQFSPTYPLEGGRPPGGFLISFSLLLARGLNKQSFAFRAVEPRLADQWSPNFGPGPLDCYLAAVANHVPPDLGEVLSCQLSKSLNSLLVSNKQLHSAFIAAQIGLALFGVLDWLWSLAQRTSKVVF